MSLRVILAVSAAMAAAAVLAEAYLLPAGATIPLLLLAALVVTAVASGIAILAKSRIPDLAGWLLCVLGFGLAFHTGITTVLWFTLGGQSPVTPVLIA